MSGGGGRASGGSEDLSIQLPHGAQQTHSLKERKGSELLGK